MTIGHLHTPAEFDSFMSQNRNNSVVIDFYATWCGPCKQLAPMLENWAKQYNHIKFAKVDVDENETVAAANKVRAMPTLHFYKNGAKVAEVQGADARRIEQYLRGL